MDFETRLENFVKIVKQKIDDKKRDLYSKYDNLDCSEIDEKVETTRGKKYVKLIHNGSVHCFVNISNGDIMKAETWSRPAKHARGNIFNEDNGAGAVGAYGANYM